ncbi:MAG: OmpH/Skp family outer membrane protein [Planctomycetota bacterium]|jgi:Skp family chaperone for outer membrane proteins
MQRRHGGTLLAFFGLILLGGSTVFAQDGGLRIAVVRIEDAINNYQRSKDMRKTIEASFKQQKEAVDKTASEIETMKAELRKESARLTPGSYQMFERVQKIKAKEFLFKTLRDSYRKDMNEEMVNYYKTVFADFQKAVAQYSNDPEVRIDLVIRSANDELKSKDAMGIQGEIGMKILHYYRPTLDITAQVTQVMDRNYKDMKKKRR